jgi:hypothetical protein
MSNPFKKRATEYVLDAASLLPLVSARPIEDFLDRDRDALFEKLSVIVGTPGCGKTTIARILEFETLAALNAQPSMNEDLTDVLRTTGVLAGSHPSVIAYRLAMTTNFRNIWELPYQDSLKAALLRAYVQSRAVLGWFRQMQDAGVAIDNISVDLREDSESAATVLHARSGGEFYEYAKEVDLAIFKIVTALIAPPEDAMASLLNTRYDVFEELKGFRIPISEGRESAALRPMIIIDDAHELHPSQFAQLREWLQSRVISVARWIMCRPDVVAPEDYRDALTKESAAENGLTPGTAPGRDYLLKLMQLGARESKRFKLVARDVANRYIAGIPELARRGISDIRQVLDQATARLPEGEVKQLTAAIEKLARQAKFGESLIKSLDDRIPGHVVREERLKALLILLNREKNRTPQMALIGEQRDTPITDDRATRADVVDGARIQLLHEFDRPYYFGSDKLSEASNANIEQFIRLCGTLVDELMARIVRGHKAELSARSQHDALVKQADLVIKAWDFPYHVAVRGLVERIADQCLQRTLLPNAPLDDGANAIGIPQEEMDRVLRRSERLTRVLHFAFAYKALVFVPQYRCKNRVWCLLELGSLPCLKHGLTLRRGGFIEDTLTGLESLVPE